MRYSVSIWIQYAYSVSISLEEPIEGQTNIFLFFKLFFHFFQRNRLYVCSYTYRSFISPKNSFSAQVPGMRFNGNSKPEIRAKTAIVGHNKKHIGVQIPFRGTSRASYTQHGS